MNRHLVIIALSAWISGVLYAPAYAKILHEERSLYSQLIVKKIGNTICLQFNVRSDQRNQSCIDPRRPKEMVFSYTRMSMASLLYVQQPSNILVIGLGGGTLPTAFHQLYPDAHIDTVEIDPAVVKVAEEFFGFRPADNLKVYTTDARVWTKRALTRERRYDLIILDAFNGEYIPEHLMTMEYLEENRQLLSPKGTLIANTFAQSDLYHAESATYASVFGDFINFRVPESANRVIIVPGENLSEDDLSSRAELLAAPLRPYSVPIKRYAKIIAEQMDDAPDWRARTRVLTDQFSPANLLKEK
ncbi:MAG: fused MFS/spermidine synthase [Pseudomonadales bacterium]|nr:fused MFS/spermidine synthase [Pseudomonadales bacterium]